MPHPKKELSKEEIDYLFDFVKSKNAKYLDVSFEIVDHLATSIEEKMEHNSDHTFQSALEEVYGSFPITGFAVFINGKIEAMQKYWRRKFWTSFRSFFRIPMILATIMIYASFVFLFSKFECRLIYVMIPFVAAGIFGIIYFFAKRMMDKKRSKPTYLIIDSYQKFMIAIFHLLTVPIWNLKKHVIINTNFEIQLYAVLFTVLIIILILAFYSFPRFLKMELREKYDHLKIDPSFFLV